MEHENDTGTTGDGGQKLVQARVIDGVQCRLGQFGRQVVHGGRSSPGWDLLVTVSLWPGGQ